jgi:hypothetical protein
MADDLAFEGFDGVLQAFDKLAHDTNWRQLIFDLDRDLAAHLWRPFGSRTIPKSSAC